MKEKIKETSNKKPKKILKGYCGNCKKVVEVEKIRTLIRPYFKFVCIKCHPRKKE